MIHFVNMPFASLTHPNLPLGIFQAQLAAAGIESEVFNLNLDFAQAIGYSGYESIAFFRGVETQVGEWLFAKAAWGEDFGPPQEEFLSLCGEELDNIPKIPDKIAWLRQIRNEVVPYFLGQCINLLQARGELQIVAFSCRFFQTISSLAMGRLIKESLPHVKLIYGGSCFHGEMGDAIMRTVPWIDAVSIGEADDTIIPLVEALLEQREPAVLHGVLYRDSSGAVREGEPSAPASHEVIQSLPDPNFDSFFRDAKRIGLDQDESWRIRLLAPFESSRGCWWGEKHHCTFCGLNGQGMVYRGKSGAQVGDMLRRLAARYPQIQRYQASDNIMSINYFQTLLPQLAERPLPNGVELFYSVKSNMRRKQIKALADAGVKYLQPGIESLSTHILQLMNKGVTALQNVFFLKCCREYGIMPYWNNLIRLPGERQEDYDRMESWIPKLHHLQPPYGGAPKIECHRFSPYFVDQECWTNGTLPQAWYAGIFPAERMNLNRVAYYFDADWKDVLGDPAYDNVIRATLEWIRIWKEEEELPQLKIRKRGGNGIDIVDTRCGEAGLWQLDALETAIYYAIDAPANTKAVAKHVHAATGHRLPEASVKEILDSYFQADIALYDDGRYLAVALAEWTVDPPLAFRRGMSKQSINNQDPDRHPVALA